jgi:hypothetical protein
VGHEILRYFDSRYCTDSLFSFLLWSKPRLSPRLKWWVEHGLSTCLFYRSGLPPPFLAHRLRQPETRRLSIRHRGRTQCRVGPKRVLGRAIFMLETIEIDLGDF